MENKERNYVILNGKKVELGSTNPSSSNNKMPEKKPTDSRNSKRGFLKGLCIVLLCVALLTFLFMVLVAPMRDRKSVV